MSAILHTALGVAALALGFALAARRKGTPVHKWTGRAYALAMLALCISSLGIPAEVGPTWGRFGVFHAIAVAGVVYLAFGVLPVLWRGSVRDWYQKHLYFTLWSFVGLLMATLSHVYEPVALTLMGPVGLTPQSASITTAILLWGVPTVLGTVCIERLKAKYRRKYGDGSFGGPGELAGA